MTRTLAAIAAARGLPRAIRCDNGPELTGRHFLAWCLERRIELLHIRPGRPTENGRVESFHGRLREECLNVSWFQNLFDARQKIAAWRDDYNHLRPHSGLGYLTPVEFASRDALCQRSAGPGASDAGPWPHTPIPAQTGADSGPECRILG